MCNPITDKWENFALVFSFDLMNVLNDQNFLKLPDLFTSVRFVIK